MLQAMRRRIAVLLGVVAIVAGASRANAQGSFISTASSDWCKDSGTYCWSQTGGTLSGLRIVGEPKFGTIFSKGDNRISNEGFGKVSIIGLESNLYGTIASLQLSVITPGRVTLDDDSPLRKSGRLNNANGEVGVDGGWAIGISLFNGVLAVGRGSVSFDYRQITNPTSTEKGEHYLYFNVQAISAIRAAVSAAK